MWEWIAQVLSAAVGTAAFALLFSVPPSCYLRCGVTGGLIRSLFCKKKTLSEHK